MVVCASTDDGKATFDQFLGKYLGILLDLFCPLLELWFQCLTESYRLGGDDMLQWTALLTREYSGVQ